MARCLQVAPGVFVSAQVGWRLRRRFSDRDSGVVMQVILVSVAGQVFGLRSDRVDEVVGANDFRVRGYPNIIDPVVGVTSRRDWVSPVVDVRVALGFPSFRTAQERASDLEDTLAQRERDHVGWLLELERCCRSGAEFTKPRCPHQCAFGRWYDELRASAGYPGELSGGDPRVEAALQGFDAPHRRIHEIADRALDLSASGDLDAAISTIEDAKTSDLAELLRLFKEVVSVLKELARARGVIITEGTERAVLLVDNVLGLRTVPEAEIEDTRERASHGDLVTGLLSVPVRRDEPELVCLLDHRRLMPASDPLPAARAG